MKSDEIKIKEKGYWTSWKEGLIAGSIFDLLKLRNQELLDLELREVNTDILSKEFEGKSLFRHLIDEGYGNKIPPQSITAELLLEKNNNGVAAVHVMAEQGILKTVPVNILEDTILETKDKDGRNVFHHAYLGGQESNLPQYYTVRDVTPDNFGNLTVTSKQSEIQNLPAFTNSKDNKGLTPQEQKSDLGIVKAIEERFTSKVEFGTRPNLEELLKEYHLLEDFLVAKKNKIEEFNLDNYQLGTYPEPHEFDSLKAGFLLLLEKRNKVLKEAAATKQLHTLEIGRNKGIIEGKSLSGKVNLVKLYELEKAKEGITNGHEEQPSNKNTSQKKGLAKSLTDWLDGPR